MAPKPKFENITPVTYSSLGWTFDAKNGRQPKIINKKFIRNKSIFERMLIQKIESFTIQNLSA